MKNDSQSYAPEVRKFFVVYADDMHHGMEDTKHYHTKRKRPDYNMLTVTSWYLTPDVSSGIDA